MSCHVPNCNSCGIRPACLMFRLYEDVREHLNATGPGEQRASLFRAAKTMAELEKQFGLQIEVGPQTPVEAFVQSEDADGYRRQAEGEES